MKPIHPIALIVTHKPWLLFWSMRNFKANVGLVPFSFCQPPTSNWHKISWNNCLFSVFMLYVAWKRGLPRKFTRFVLFCPINKSVFLISCVFWTSSACWTNYVVGGLVPLSSSGWRTKQSRPVTINLSWHRISSGPFWTLCVMDREYLLYTEKLNRNHLIKK